MSACMGTRSIGYLFCVLMLSISICISATYSDEQEEVTQFENKYTKEQNTLDSSKIVHSADESKIDLNTEKSGQSQTSDKDQLIDSPDVKSTSKEGNRDEALSYDTVEKETLTSDKTEVDIDSVTGSKIDYDSKIKPSERSEDSSNNQSYFSIGNIIKKIVDPVFEELEKPAEVREIKVEAQNSSGSENMSQINETLENSTLAEIVPIANKTERKAKFTCVGRNMTLEENRTAVVEIINNTRLVGLLSFDKNETTSDCVLVLFYAPYCQFCAKLGASYNALARVFPQLEVVAVDAAQFSNLNAKFGTVSVPNILLFHESKSAVRFNQTEKSFETLIEFVKNSTGLNPNMTVNITEEDYIGPLPSVPVETSDYLLWLAWVFVIMCSTFMFVNSNKGQQWINKVKILWQEHQHIE